jgi:H+-transporting ATPase
MELNANPPRASASKPGSKPDAKDDLESLPLAELEKKLGSSADGLTQAEAQKRLTRYGPNEIEEKKTNEFLKFLSYFWGPIPWMIEAAVILSAVARWPGIGRTSALSSFCFWPTLCSVSGKNTRPATPLLS